MGRVRQVGFGWLVIAVAGAGFLASVGASPASAQTTRGSSWSPPTTRAPGAVETLADFDGHSIDLSTNWEDAKACVVLRQANVIECFRTTAEGEAEANAINSQFAASGFSCWSPLRLYEHSAFGGRQLMFFDRYYWQNLPDYGFNDQTSSYRVGACYSYLAEHSNGGGAFYPGPIAPWSSVAWMITSWND
ncbi:MAG TPA: hypothetical protein VF244_05090, partial [Acidimicrobiales bacterium]